MSEEVKKWLKKAEKDLLAAKINLQQELYDVSSFLSHQAAEKALKALYILKFKRLWKTHDLVGLLVKLNSEEDLLEICDELNRHYIDTRYPSEAEYTETVAEDAIKNSKKVIEWHVKHKIGYPVDFICYTPDEFNRLKHEVSIVSEALREGIEI